MSHARFTRAALALTALATLACQAQDGTFAAAAEGDLHSACSMGTTTRGIDVSAWQATIDWNRVAASGVEFAFIRVSDGTHSIDSRFSQNWSGAHSAGVLRGAYQFFRAGQDVSAQANIMINALRADGGELAPVIDVEADSIQGRSSAQVVAEVEQWIQLVGAATGTTPIIYTGTYVTGSSSPMYASSPLWEAAYFLDYTSSHCPRINDNWDAWTFWQYSDRGHVPGISGNVDMDVFNGTTEQLVAFAGGHAPMPPPPPPATTGALSYPTDTHNVSSYVTHTRGSGLVRYDCTSIVRANHKGTDFAVARGTPVHAAGPGSVIRAVDGCVEGATTCGGSFGNHVILQHADGRATLYGHMTQGTVRVHVGDHIECGQELGMSGNTGHSTGPHVHFEVRDGVTGIGNYYSRGPTDPFGGHCSTQAHDLWGDACRPSAALDDARYVSSTYPRQITVTPGQTLTQAWRLENTGTTTWSTAGNYALVHTGGPSLMGLSRAAVPSDVAPHGQMRFEVTFQAPTEPGNYVVTYQMSHGTSQFGDVVQLSIRVPGSASCHSATLGTTVASGSCVQVAYAGCGQSSCAWYACSNGAWTCTAESSCMGETHANDACAPPPPPPTSTSCETLSCGDCVATPDCTFCPGSGQCVAAADAASCTGGTTMSAGACDECHPVGFTCTDRFDCCNATTSSDIQCIQGFCEDITMCEMNGDTCAPGDTNTHCCGLGLCGQDTGGAWECCLAPNNQCTSDANCCGFERCVSGVCQAQAVGQSCMNTQECDGASYCLDDHTCGF
jgi:lysozyme